MDCEPPQRAEVFPARGYATDMDVDAAAPQPRPAPATSMEWETSEVEPDRPATRRHLSHPYFDPPTAPVPAALPAPRGGPSSPPAQLAETVSPSTLGLALLPIDWEALESLGGAGAMERPRKSSCFMLDGVPCTVILFFFFFCKDKVHTVQGHPGGRMRPNLSTYIPG